MDSSLLMLGLLSGGHMTLFIHVQWQTFTPLLIKYLIKAFNRKPSLGLRYKQRHSITALKE